MVPSKNLVLVQSGASSVKSAWNDDAFVASMLAALPEQALKSRLCQLAPNYFGHQ